MSRQVVTGLSRFDVHTEQKRVLVVDTIFDYRTSKLFFTRPPDVIAQDVERQTRPINVVDDVQIVNESEVLTRSSEDEEFSLNDSNEEESMFNYAGRLRDRGQRTVSYAYPSSSNESEESESPTDEREFRPVVNGYSF